MIRKLRKKPVEIQGVQFINNQIECIEFTNKQARAQSIKGENGIVKDWVLIIPTLEGPMIATKGDWILRGVNGEFYPCKPEIKEKTYDDITEITSCDNDDLHDKINEILSPIYAAAKIYEPDPDFDIIHQVRNALIDLVNGTKGENNG